MRRGRAKVLAMAARMMAGEWPHNPPSGRGVCWRTPGPGVFHRVKRLTAYDYTSPTGAIVNVTDNAGRVSQAKYDLLGRTVWTIQNHEDGL